MPEDKSQHPEDSRPESTLGFRVSPQLHARIKEAAKREGLSVKRWMTLAAEQRLRGHRKRICPDRGPRNELELDQWNRYRRLKSALRAARRTLNELFKVEKD
jgi:hypothetical protein